MSDELMTMMMMSMSSLSGADDHIGQGTRRRRRTHARRMEVLSILEFSRRPRHR